MCGLKAAQKYLGVPAGPPYNFVRPFGSTHLYNLPFWIKNYADIRITKLAVHCRELRSPASPEGCHEYTSFIFFNPK